MENGRIESIEMAKYILCRASANNISMNMTKLQKLLYICDGLMLSCDRNYINENARAWNYGPVYPKVHKWFKDNQEIRFTLSDIKKEDLDFINSMNIEYIVKLALSKFGSWTAGELSSWSHQNNSPWDIALRNNDNHYGAVIDKFDMAAYFKGLTTNA